MNDICTEEKKSLVIPEFHDGWDEKKELCVTLNGQPVGCHRARVSRMPFNTVWPGHQRPLSQTEVATFITFDMDAPVEVCVRYPRAPKEVTIRPLSRQIAGEIRDKEVTFTIREPGQYTVEADGRHNALHVFANPMEESEGRDATYQFRSGVFRVGRLELKSGESLYIGADAVVYGAVCSVDSENVHIYGRGVLDGSEYVRDANSVLSEGLVYFQRCKNLRMEGIILRDPCMWTVTSVNCVGLTFDNVKLIGLWRYNSDGFDFVNSRDVHVLRCFLRTFDDSIVLKGLRLDDQTEKMDLENYLIEDCVVWCDWGGALEIGAETIADRYRHIRFQNCDIIRTDQGALRVQSGDRADISDVSYENIRIEYSAHDQRARYQKNDAQTYDPGDLPAHDWFIRDWMYCDMWSQDHLLGHVHEISYNDIFIYKDEAVPMPMALFRGGDAEHLVENVRVENVYCNGEKITPVAQCNDFTQNISGIVPEEKPEA